MAVAAHDQEICGDVGGMREDSAGDIGLDGDNRVDFHLHPVAGEMVRDVCPGHFVALCRLAGHGQDFSGASPFAALCGRTSNLYPTPGTERMNRGAFGSGSILRRRRATSISTLRS